MEPSYEPNPDETPTVTVDDLAKRLLRPEILAALNGTGIKVSVTLESRVTIEGKATLVGLLVAVLLVREAIHLLAPLLSQSP